jgi:hypothetical protein
MSPPEGVQEGALFGLDAGRADRAAALNGGQDEKL